MSILILLLTLISGHTSWTSARSSPEPILEGTWVSCPDNDDSSYGERVFTWRVGRTAVAEVHLGPRDEFAVFRGEVEEERSHGSRENLLGPAFHYEDVPTVAGGRNWSLTNMHLNIVRAPGSYDECYTFFIKIDGYLPKVAHR
jgi:hypothetical protein